jgi:hypothetical protein
MLILHCNFFWRSRDGGFPRSLRIAPFVLQFDLANERCFAVGTAYQDCITLLGDEAAAGGIIWLMGSPSFRRYSHPGVDSPCLSPAGPRFGDREPRHFGLGGTNDRGAQSVH